MILLFCYKSIEKKYMEDYNYKNLSFEKIFDIPVPRFGYFWPTQSTSADQVDNTADQVHSWKSGITNSWVMCAHISCIISTAVFARFHSPSHAYAWVQSISHPSTAFRCSLRLLNALSTCRVMPLVCWLFNLSSLFV